MKSLRTLLPALLLVCLVVLARINDAEGCSCSYTHPQTHFCTSDFVLVVKVKERIPLEHETAYRVKINRKFKLSNESHSQSLLEGRLYTASMDSVCGVHLNVGETYIVSGRVYEGKPRIGLCNLVQRWSGVSRRQRRAFKGLYAKGCMCDVSYTPFERKGEALHRAKGRLCPWEANPGPTDCQEQHGVCVMNQGRCFWMPSRSYDQCIHEHHQERLKNNQRMRDFMP
ncbi:tissue inhibitor of metalloproteinase [Trichogramma pretiosum]|uniref:tissue inhibitor of metalloproteinase n=1 Tax=Trichogramma pretiosum TaxID=7493 RepID=UPI0006C97235|nr:tissue inhibitor of metalloproteinase [Trichogramma pretiosum]XP_014237295.1 tissue inhibitor of metalloproteinase [Trichogramma pretiosum]XP_014237296.1 tissue inhibitor of metalloproteinase [Trichogramma pretiosum]XP_023315655.1 tissue inhibitor of metalloproteinase [Trichogramma pretiosum]